MTIDNIERQRAYVETQEVKAKGLGLVFADAFLRGMRDIGYKNPAWAISELVDNSAQAAATSVSIRFGFGEANKKKATPDQIAICDDGNGMIPKMISYAVRWGGTDRENDRTGFGRYGYGLPSSAVSMSKRYTVYAKTADSEWHAVTVDIDKMAAAAGDPDKTQALLMPRAAEPPAWVDKAAKGDDKLKVQALVSGVVIVLEDLDRLNRLQGWIRCDSLKARLLQHLGVVYRHFIPEKRIVVDGVLADAVDPLFLMEHGWLYRDNSVLAERIETRTIEMDTPNGKTGKVRIRASILPPNFPSANPDVFKEDFRNREHNKRYDIMRTFNGILICRAGRQIDTFSPRSPNFKFQNNDAYIKIEIDFDPVLDEYFSVTTAKQQIVIEDEMWEKLRNPGANGGNLENLLRDMRGRWKAMAEELKAKAGNAEAGDGPRPSSLAMMETEKFKPAELPPTSAQLEEGQRNLDDAASEQSRATGRPKEVVREEIEQKSRAKKWEVEFQAIPEGPFYRPYRLGEQKRVIINTEHPFYSRIYQPVGAARHALEVMLFVLAERELESIGDAQLFYKAERQRWSERLRHALGQLISDESLADSSSMAEIMYNA
jgi:hypothetical protein